MSTSASFERDGQFGTKDPSIGHRNTPQHSVDDLKYSCEGQNYHQVQPSSPPAALNAAHYHAHASTKGTTDLATGDSEAPGRSLTQQEVHVSSSPVSISSIPASASTTPLAASESSPQISAASSTATSTIPLSAAPNPIPNSGRPTLDAVRSQAPAAAITLSSNPAANGGPSHVQSGVQNGPHKRCDIIYAEIMRLNAWRTLPVQQQPAAAVRQAQEKRVKELYAELFEAGRARLPSRKPGWACSTEELYDQYPAFGFWMRGAIDPSFLIPINLDNWLFPRHSVTPQHIWGLAQWAGFTMSDGGAEAIWWKLIRGCPRRAEESISTWRDRLWVCLGRLVAESAAENREYMDLMEASQKRKRAAEDLMDDHDQRPSKKGKGKLGDRATSTAKSSSLLGTSNDGHRAISAKSSKLSGTFNDGPRATSAESSKPSGASNDGPRAASAESSKPSGASNNRARAKLPVEAPYDFPVVPTKKDDDKSWIGSLWPKRHGRVLYRLLKARRDYEKAHDAGKADQLRDVRLWNEMSRKLKAYNIFRTGSASKMFWNRVGRIEFEYEERINPKNPSQLVASAQPSKRDREAKQSQREEEGEDESEEEGEDESEDEGEDEGEDGIEEEGEDWGENEGEDED